MAGLVIGETVTVLARTQTGVDRYGKPIYGWPGPGVEVAGCAVAPRTSEEPVQVGRQAVITGLQVYFPPGVEIGPHDRLLIRDELFYVEGDAGEWLNPYSAVWRGVEVAVSRVEG